MDTHLALKPLETADIQLDGSVIEIGSQRHVREGSSTFLLALAEKRGLEFRTCDFAEASHTKAAAAVGDHAVMMDGAEFLRGYDKPISVLYLDNYDIVWGEAHHESMKQRFGALYAEKNIDLNDAVGMNLRSAEVHLSQAVAALPKMAPTSLIAIDDTVWRGASSIWWGKGALAIPYLVVAGFSILKREPRGVVLARNVPAGLLDVAAAPA